MSDEFKGSYEMIARALVGCGESALAPTADAAAQDPSTRGVTPVGSRSATAFDDDLRDVDDDRTSHSEDRCRLLTERPSRIPSIVTY